jgi:hypothetical protein
MEPGGWGSASTWGMPSGDPGVPGAVGRALGWPARPPGRTGRKRGDLPRRLNSAPAARCPDRTPQIQSESPTSVAVIPCGLSSRPTETLQ